MGISGVFTLGPLWPLLLWAVLSTSRGAHMLVFLLCVHLAVELLGHKAGVCGTLGDAFTHFYQVVTQLPSHQPCEGSSYSTSCKHSIPILQLGKIKGLSAWSQTQLVSHKNRIHALIKPQILAELELCASPMLWAEGTVSPDARGPHPHGTSHWAELNLNSAWFEANIWAFPLCCPFSIFSWSSEKCTVCVQ